jgi:hypothetical protein
MNRPDDRRWSQMAAGVLEEIGGAAEATTMRWKVSAARPDAIASSIFARASAASAASRPSTSISAESATVTSWNRGSRRRPVR